MMRAQRSSRQHDAKDHREGTDARTLHVYFYTPARPFVRHLI